MQRDISNIWDYSIKGRKGITPPVCDVFEFTVPVDFKRKKDAELPEVSELDLMRHFTRLSSLNYNVDANFYPLGSCTMKFNPRVNEVAANLEGFTLTHPLGGKDDCQGSLELMYKLQQALAKISGFDSVTLQPAAGAHGEFTGALIIKAYHQDKGDLKRTKILIPDSAHGTNPATVSMVGFEAVEIPSNENGLINIEALKLELDDTVAGIMITNPNTLGLFETNILQINELVHQAGGLVYGDGANFNAIMGIVKPAELGFDIMHFNLHKTFSTPHGGGGPGAGPVGVVKKLAEFLPSPMVNFNGEKYYFEEPLKSIGKVKANYGNFSVLVRAYVYILMMGADGLKNASQTAVLNANYIKAKLKDVYKSEHRGFCMHEFVTSGAIEQGIHTLDVAKRLIDFGFHPPTIYFPLIVSEAMMIEPTETESKQTMDIFINALLEIALEAKNNPDVLHNAPLSTKISRLDEVNAARNPVLKEQKED